METKWTPGPWCRRPRATNINHLPDDCAHVGTVASFEWHIALVFADGDESLRAQAPHNAALIASAPELYEALEEMVEQAITWFDQEPQELQDALKVARAALKKARGES